MFSKPHGDSGELCNPTIYNKTAPPFFSLPFFSSVNAHLTFFFLFIFATGNMLGVSSQPPHSHYATSDPYFYTSSKATMEKDSASSKGVNGNGADLSGLETLTMAAAAMDSNKKQQQQQANEIPIMPALSGQAEPAHSTSSSPQLSGPMSIASLTNPTHDAGGPALASHTSSTGSTRRKKQCPQCMGWFSNLATHKSIHLADNSRPHTCSICGRGFARPNDLFRHQKSHRGDAPFRCPLFVKPSVNRADPNSTMEPACHQNGGFSRCDTYKNHLKAMHFEYPAGTKKRDRNGMSGRCKGCGLSFKSTDDWISEHIEKHECEGIKRIQTSYAN